MYFIDIDMSRKREREGGKAKVVVGTLEFPNHQLEERRKIEETKERKKEIEELFS